MSPHGVTSALRVPADLTVVGFVRSAFACVLEREAWPAEGSGRVLLAASEAVTNAIEHGSPAGGRVHVEIAVAPERVAVRVIDQGRPGVPVPRWPSAPPPPTSLRGRGLVIIRRLADDADLAAAGGGTEVRLGFDRVAARAEALEELIAARAA